MVTLRAGKSKDNNIAYHKKGTINLSVTLIRTVSLEVTC